MPTVLATQPRPLPCHATHKTPSFGCCFCQLQQGQGHYTKCKQGDAPAGKHTKKQDEYAVGGGFLPTTKKGQSVKKEMVQGTHFTELP